MDALDACDRVIRVDDPAAPRADDDATLHLAMHPKGGVFEIRKTTASIGRHQSSDIRLHLPDISRNHGRLSYTERSWEIFDLDSTNGIFVNGERVSRALLRNGDIMQIGSYFFQVSIGPALAPDGGQSAGPDTLPGLTPAEEFSDGNALRKAS